MLYDPDVDSTQRVKMSDVARTAGVSVATVSKVVNGRYGVAQATVERVQQVITSSATRRASARRACAATAPTCWASWSPSSSRSPPNCSRGPPGGRRHRLRAAGLLRRRPRRRRRLGAAIPGPAVRHADRRRRDRHPDGGRDRTAASTWWRSTRTPGRPACPPSTRTTSPAPCWRPSTCSGSATGGSGTSADGRTWSPRGCARPASAGDGRRPACRGRRRWSRVGGYRLESADGAGPRAARPRRTGRPRCSPRTTCRRSRRWTVAARARADACPDDLSVIGFDNVPESALATPAADDDQAAAAADGRRSAAPAGGPDRRRGAATHIRLPTELVVRASQRSAASLTPGTCPGHSPTIVTPTVRESTFVSSWTSPVIETGRTCRRGAGEVSADPARPAVRDHSSGGLPRARPGDRRRRVRPDPHLDIPRLDDPTMRRSRRRTGSSAPRTSRGRRLQAPARRACSQEGATGRATEPSTSWP